MTGKSDDAPDWKLMDVDASDDDERVRTPPEVSDVVMSEAEELIDSEDERRTVDEPTDSPYAPLPVVSPPPLQRGKDEGERTVCFVDSKERYWLTNREPIRMKLRRIKGLDCPFRCCKARNQKLTRQLQRNIERIHLERDNCEKPDLDGTNQRKMNEELRRHGLGICLKHKCMLLVKTKVKPNKSHSGIICRRTCDGCAQEGNAWPIPMTPRPDIHGTNRHVRDELVVPRYDSPPGEVAFKKGTVVHPGPWQSFAPVKVVGRKLPPTQLTLKSSRLSRSNPPQNHTTKRQASRSSPNYAAKPPVKKSKASNSAVGKEVSLVRKLDLRHEDGLDQLFENALILLLAVPGTRIFARNSC